MEITIRELAEKIKEVVKFEGRLKFDTSKPDGTPRKLMDIGLLKKLGFEAKTDLRDGLEISNKDFLQHRLELCL